MQILGEAGGRQVFVATDPLAVPRTIGSAIQHVVHLDLISKSN